MEDGRSPAPATAQTCMTAWLLGSTTRSIPDCVEWNFGQRSPSLRPIAATRSCESSQVAGKSIHPPLLRERNKRAWKDHHKSAVPSPSRSRRLDPVSTVPLGREVRASLEGAFIIVARTMGPIQAARKHNSRRQGDTPCMGTVGPTRVAVPVGTIVASPNEERRQLDCTLNEK
jgi:hypothetical protein